MEAMFKNFVGFPFDIISGTFDSVAKIFHRLCFTASLFLSSSVFLSRLHVFLALHVSMRSFANQLLQHLLSLTKWLEERKMFYFGISSKLHNFCRWYVIQSITSLKSTSLEGFAQLFLLLKVWFKVALHLLMCAYTPLFLTYGVIYV